MRAFMAVRARFAEDELALAVRRGVAQFVILGAGLDTFAYRNPFPNLRVFEVDHPATQEWKRQRLHAENIAIPDSVTYAPVDFNSQTLADGLRAANFQADKPAFFSWLGVTMYLENQTVLDTLRFIHSMSPENGIVFDYTVPRHLLNTDGKSGSRRNYEARRSRRRTIPRILRAGGTGGGAEADRLSPY